mmetsp:Transcript_8281/g.16598  ORF Transcript_8281/g.16598 Transcript_8281/m.16598 type:complete len:305 (-) Transcript_8281:190-1104(-)
MADGLCGAGAGISGGGVDAKGVVLVLVGYVRNPVGGGGGEEEDLRLAPVGGSGVLEDLLHVVGKAHVEHLVGLVEDGDVDLGQVKVATVEVIDAPAGGGDDDVDTGLEGPGLGVVRDAAVEEGHVKVQRLRHLSQLLGNLPRQLPGRSHDDHARPAAAGGAVAVLVDAAGAELVKARHGGEAKGKGLAGSRAGAANHVTSGEGRLKSLSLHGGKRRDGLVRKNIDDLLVETSLDPTGVQRGKVGRVRQVELIRGRRWDLLEDLRPLKDGVDFVRNDIRDHLSIARRVGSRIQLRSVAIRGSEEA